MMGLEEESHAKTRRREGRREEVWGEDVHATCSVVTWYATLQDFGAWHPRTLGV